MSIRRIYPLDITEFGRTLDGIANDKQRPLCYIIKELIREGLAVRGVNKLKEGDKKKK